MTAMRSFYVPHDRAATAYTGELVDEVTGEVYRPPVMVKQSFVAECDINNILKQFKLTGQIQHMSAKAALGSYEDLPEPLDFQEALNTVKDAEQSFATLPSQIRDRFGNDPGNFLDFMSNPNNQDEIIKLGLATDSRPPKEPDSPPPPPPSP